jgi:hypothetical protein
MMIRAFALARQEEVPTERLHHMIYACPSFHPDIEDALRDLDAA